jgi:hypothetical protein
MMRRPDFSDLIWGLEEARPEGKYRIHVMNTKSYLRPLLMVLAICFLGFTGCSTVDPQARKGSQPALIGKMDPHPNEDEEVLTANRDWYTLIP